MFEVGKSVSLQYQITPSSVVTFAGVIMAKPKWLKPNEIAMSTGNPEFPMRVLQTQQIIGSKKSTETKVRSFKVKSKNKMYQVIVSNGNFSCNCMGFSFRRTCKHLVAVEQHLQKNVLTYSTK